MTRNILSSILLIFALTACVSNKKAEEQTQNASEETANTTNTEVMTTAPDTDGPKIAVHTTAGDFTLMLYNDTPLHRDNFLQLVDNHVYDGLLFHRVINNFMIQGGDPESRNAAPGQMLGSGEYSQPIDAEIVYPRHFHKRGALAAARQGDMVNPERRSSSSQFYIVTGEVYDDATLNMFEQRLGYHIPANIREAYKTVGGTPHLDDQYTVYGEVIDGMDVIDAIQKVRTDNNDRPVEDVRIISMERIAE